MAEKYRQGDIETVLLQELSEKPSQDGMKTSAVTLGQLSEDLGCSDAKVNAALRDAISTILEPSTVFVPIESVVFDPVKGFRIKKQCLEVSVFSAHSGPGDQDDSTEETK